MVQRSTPWQPITWLWLTRRAHATHRSNEAILCRGVGEQQCQLFNFKFKFWRIAEWGQVRKTLRTARVLPPEVEKDSTFWREPPRPAPCHWPFLLHDAQGTQRHQPGDHALHTVSSTMVSLAPGQRNNHRFWAEWVTYFLTWGTFRLLVLNPMTLLQKSASTWSQPQLCLNSTTND